MFEIDRRDLGDRRRLLATGSKRVVAFLEFRVLRREPVSIDDDASLRRLEPLVERQAGDAGWIVEQLDVGHVMEPEVLPPFHLVLAAMPLEQLREDPLRLLGPIPLKRQSGREGVGDRSYASETLVELLRGPGRWWRGPRDRTAVLLLRLHSEALEPVAKLQSGKAVVAVVRANRFANLRREKVGFALRDRIFDCAQVPRHLLEVDHAGEAIERLELLDRVALDAGAKCLLHDAV